tara:strand:- start:894 stop:1109 length:216 start_codon:yes stop_codon:yes gene_type:complete
MNITFDETIDGFRFTGLAELEHGESATDTSPSWPAIVTVFALHIDGNGKDVMDIIDPAIVQRIEKLLVEDV